MPSFFYVPYVPPSFTSLTCLLFLRALLASIFLRALCTLIFSRALLVFIFYVPYVPSLFYLPHVLSFFYVPYVSYLLMCLRYSYLFMCLTCLIFLYDLGTLIFLCDLRVLSLMYLTSLYLSTCLHFCTFHTHLKFLLVYRAFIFLRTNILFTCSRFSDRPSSFLRNMILLKCFKLFACLACLNFLHALFYFIFSFQTPNIGGKGGTD